MRDAALYVVYAGNFRGVRLDGAGTAGNDLKFVSDAVNQGVVIETNCNDVSFRISQLGDRPSFLADATLQFLLGSVKPLTRYESNNFDTVVKEFSRVLCLATHVRSFLSDDA